MRLPTRRRGRAAQLAVVTLAVALAACTSPASTSSTPTELVLSSPQPVGEFNPINGYGELGVSPLYDGLLRLESHGDTQIPALAPALAASLPQPNHDQTVWTVPLRDDVTFSNGQPLTADDVAATYRAVLDPQHASDVAGAYSMIRSVDAVDAHTVRFTLDYSYAAFPERLLLGIAPAGAIAAGPAADAPLNTQPVGTGPYVLEKLTPTEAVMTARDDYFRGPPPVDQLTFTVVEDPNTRAQQMQAGAVDGTVLPPVLANTFTDQPGTRVDAVESADWRGVSLPAGNPFTADPQARLAMNLAVDRQSMVEHVLAGRGRPAPTPVAAVYGDAHNPDARFDYDPSRAARILDDAGWAQTGDGTRARGGQNAEFTVYYDAKDAVRRDLAEAFAAAMHDIGVTVHVRGATWDVIDTKLDTAAVMLGGGDKPYSLDTQVYGALHTRSSHSDPYDNPGDFTIPGVDAALDDARRSLDPARRAADYRRVQAAYVDHPSYVFLAFLDHTYVSAETGWDTGPLVMEPHSHGVNWGPWWNIADWTRK